MRCMDRAALETMLGEGLSLAVIGRRVGRHESTVAYWVAKYGQRLIATGLSISQIAESLDRKPGTVRHWLREYGLRTQGFARTVRLRSRRASQS
jgi:transposase